MARRIFEEPPLKPKERRFLTAVGDCKSPLHETHVLPCGWAWHLLGGVMPATVDLQQMSTPDKLRLMEALWVDLSKGEIPSPAWHGKVLAERDRLIDSGEEKFFDWETAKTQLRDELA